MNDLQITLATGYSFPIRDCGVVPHVVACFDTFEEANAVLAKVVEEGALEAVSVYDGDARVLEFASVVLDGFQGVFAEDETITLHLYMRATGEQRDASEDAEKAGLYDILFGMEDEGDEEVQ